MIETFKREINNYLSNLSGAPKMDDVEIGKVDRKFNTYVQDELITLNMAYYVFLLRKNSNMKNIQGEQHYFDQAKILNVNATFPVFTFDEATEAPLEKTFVLGFALK